MTFEKVKEIIMDTINCSEDKITLEANLRMILELIHLILWNL